ncbi:MAG: PEP/pyruvate-binding domain-containing protein [Planctomycetaceae bacterium]|nr:PEP/pyruvate-binding domain-containing protein [Planctomycetaceae bacterium]
MPTFERVASGLAGLDKLVDNIRMGDNVVWQLDDLAQYRSFATPFVHQAIRDGRNLHYIRFANHDPLFTAMPGLTIDNFDPDEGFETFTLKIHELIGREDRDAFYVFDSLSELQTAWASDLMMGCFFQVTCPYLFEMNTVAFFGVLRNLHSFDALARIRETTQLLLNAYGECDSPYVQPLKVWNRYHPTMFSPHRLANGGADALPLDDAVEAARFHSLINSAGAISLDAHLDYWDRTFIRARADADNGHDGTAAVSRLVDMLMGRDPDIAAMACRHFDIRHLLQIKDRMIGSGSIGGKAAGMLLARRIVENSLPDLADRTEPHDSFYIGADVFYAFLVENGWWRLRLRQRTREEFFSAAEQLREKIAEGSFPPGLRDHLRRILDHFAQSPIIVRSSSLLEDGFGNAFAGKYESVFLPNSGDIEQRLAAFEKAVKIVYASSLSTSALAYRQARGLADRDEQMAILVQRVSGGNYGGYFMPCAAGVGFSHNSYVWDERIEPEAGMLRLVAGLGTRAVDRTDTDYPRIVPLGQPTLSPFAGDGERARYSQRKVDCIDLAGGKFTDIDIADACNHWPDWLRNLLCERDYEAERFYSERGITKEIFFCACRELVNNDRFCRDMRAILACLQAEYAQPVDVEFAANFGAQGDYMINLLQCRPLQSGVGGGQVVVPDIARDKTLFRVEGCTMGCGVDVNLDYVVSVDQKGYERLTMSGKYATARAIGDVVRAMVEQDKRVMLIGPGRWGTRSPDLGVPVTFAEICGITALCEVSMLDGHVRPELSFGSHFFQDLVETGIFYAAIMPERSDCLFNPALLEQYRDTARSLITDPLLADEVIRVFDLRGHNLWLKAELTGKHCICGKL